MEKKKNKIVVAVTGASGAIYAKVLFQKLAFLHAQIEDVGLIFSDNARKVWDFELGNKEYEKSTFKQYDKTDFSAPFASGSARYNIMIICPCSMGTLARIAHGISNDLVTRAADVYLKKEGN